MKNSFALTLSPLEKCLQHGANSLTDAELLALFIYSGNRKLTAHDIAQAALRRFGSLREFLSARLSEVQQIQGVGPVLFAKFQASIELSRRYYLQALHTAPLMRDFQVVQQFLLSQLRHLQEEAFCALFLDGAFRLAHFEVLFKGTVNQSPVFPRILVKKALEHNAVYIIVAHNHPSGDLQPSSADIAITEQLKQCMELMDLTLIDHFIVGNGEISSILNHISQL